MAKDSPILYVDDDIDDQELLIQAFSELGISNQIVTASTAEEALRYLRSQPAPFLILCDYKLPGMDGVTFRKEIENDEGLKGKAIPFVYFSTTVSGQMVRDVYRLNVQGLFEKSNLYSEVKNRLKQIYDYWQVCRHPNN